MKTGIRSYSSEDLAGVTALWGQVFPSNSPWNIPEEDIRRKLRVQPELFLVAVLEIVYLPAFVIFARGSLVILYIAEAKTPETIFLDGNSIFVADQFLELIASEGIEVVVICIAKGNAGERPVNIQTPFAHITSHVKKAIAIRHK